ncbi:MAG: hypothetical protein ACR2N7_10520 [Acidimicrobiia bacterium]
MTTENAVPTDTEIDKADLEAKLREIEGVVTEVEDEAIGNAKLIAVGVAVAVVGLVAYSIWRHKRNKIRIEVYKL